jgi:hypothetical protein
MRYLTFDLTESSDDILTLEAMASTREAEHAAVMAEVVQVLAWARVEFGGRQGPVEDGNAWDHELLVQHEAGGWITVTLTFSASPEFVDPFLTAFGHANE